MIPGSGNPLEEEMATHSSILTWEIPWTEEPGGLPSMGSQRDMTEHTAPKGGTRVGRHQEEETGLGWPDLGLAPDCPSALGSLGSQPGKYTIKAEIAFHVPLILHLKNTGRPS